MPRPGPHDDLTSNTNGFDVGTAMELSQRGVVDRVAFSLVYALISLSVLRWQMVASWISTVIIWELAVSPAMDWLVMNRLPERRALIANAVLNLLGASVFQALGLVCLAEGSPLGVAIGATWITGSILNTFVYFSANRLLLAATMFPAAAAAVVGPILAYGFSWKAALVPALLGLSSLASQRFSLDHGALLTQLADRQVEFADLERKLSVAVEASGDGMFELDVPLSQIEVSPAWLAMLGYAPGEVDAVIPEWRAFVHPDDLAMLGEDYEAHFRGETPHTSTELRMLCKDGDYRWVLSRGRLVSRTPDGRPARVVGTTVDISERKAMEHQLEAARDLAESANRAKSMFVANMSHEIRTPLNGVIGIAGALAQTELSASQREMVALVQSSGQMLERMLSDILDQSKIDSGKFQLQIAPFDLRQEIEAAAELMRARADEKGLDFQVSYADGAQGVFEGDAVRLRQVIHNLASNAIKFTQAGSVTIGVDAVDADQAGGATLVRIEVSDTGIGFDDETADRLFNRFVQADGSISRQFGGTGLGLSICKTLIELMGGQITVTSQPAVGSLFSVQIPLMRTLSLADYQRSAAAAGGRAETPPAAGSDLARIHVLLAEDHPTNQRVVQLILEPAGIDLTIVGNGLEAVELFEPGLFDLILMDMQMPVMDGLAATRAIRDIERKAGGAPIPIAMFSANALDEHLAMAAEAGANHHISKPITPERLLAGIEAALNQAPPQAERLARPVRA